MLLFSKQTDIVYPVLLEYAQVAFLLLYLLDERLEGFAVGFVPETVLDVYFSEEGDHVLGLVLRGVDLLDTVENDYHDDFMWHDACLLQEVLVTLLHAFDGPF